MSPSADVCEVTDKIVRTISERFDRGAADVRSGIA
jgi:hypothetical protein